MRLIFTTMFAIFKSLISLPSQRKLGRQFWFSIQIALLDRKENLVEIFENEEVCINVWEALALELQERSPSPFACSNQTLVRLEHVTSFERIDDDGEYFVVVNFDSEHDIAYGCDDPEARDRVYDRFTAMVESLKKTQKTAASTTIH